MLPPMHRKETGGTRQSAPLAIWLPGPGAGTSPCPRPSPPQQVDYPPSPASKPHYRASHRPRRPAAPQAAPDQSLASRRPPLPAGRPPPRQGPAHLALHLHGAPAAAARSVPVAAVHAEAEPRGGLRQPGRPPGARGESAWPEGSGRGCGREPPHRHLQRGGRGSSLRAELRWAAPHATRPRVGLAARPAGTRLPPSGPRRHRRRRGRRVVGGEGRG